MQGDTWGARCLEPPYTLSLSPSEATLELPLPRWIVPSEDLTVQISDLDLKIEVDGWPSPGAGRLVRRFWTAGDDGGGRSPKKAVGRRSAVVAADSSWSVMEDGKGQQDGSAGNQPQPAARAAGKTLIVVLGLRSGDAEGEEGEVDERLRRSHPCFAPRGAGAVAGEGRRGWALFEEDEDRFGLRAVLQVRSAFNCFVLVWFGLVWLVFGHIHGEMQPSQYNTSQPHPLPPKPF